MTCVQRFDIPEAADLSRHPPKTLASVDGVKRVAYLLELQDATGDVTFALAAMDAFADAKAEAEFPAPEPDERAPSMAEFAAPEVPVPLELPPDAAASLSDADMPAIELVPRLSEDKRPQACLQCRSCEQVCPQQIRISEVLADFSRKLG